MYQMDCPMNVFGRFPSILNVKFSCGNPYLELQTLMRRLFTKLRLSFLLRRLPSADLILDQFSPIGWTYLTHNTEPNLMSIKNIQASGN